VDQLVSEGDSRASRRERRSRFDPAGERRADAR